MKYLRTAMSSPLLNNSFNNIKHQVIFMGAMVFLLYVRTLSFEFIGLDEQSLLIEKKKFNKELSNIPKAFSQHVFQYEGYIEAPTSLKFYRPLLTVSFIIDEKLSRENTNEETALGKGFGVFHFTNMLFHFLAVIGLLFVLLQLKTSPPLAFFLSCLFAVHPLLTQAIAWIPGRNDSLACAFILWSYYFLQKYLFAHSIRNLFIHLFLFAGALFTKENTVMFSVLCLFTIFLLQGKSLHLNKKIILSACYFLLIVFWYFARKNAVGDISLVSKANPLAAGESWESALYYSFLKNFPLVLQYFQKTILPFNLSVMASVDDTHYGWVLLALGLFGAGIYFTKEIPWAKLLFGLLWFLLFLLPTLLFSYFEGMEHRTYLPAIGILISISFLEPVQQLSKNINRLMAISGTVILIFTSITFFRLPVFSGEYNYWKNAFETSEHSAVVCRDYGVILTKMGDFQNAEKAYLEGIKRNPKETLIHYNLGVMYFRANRYEEAKTELAKELEINSTNFMVYHVMGIIYKKENRMSEATMMWEEAAKINPRSAESYKELLSIFSQTKDTANFIRCKNELEKLGYKIARK